MTDDALLPLIARLPDVESDVVRSERVRERCHAELARQHRRRRDNARTTSAFRFWPLLASLGSVYVTEVIWQALRLYGLLQP